MTVYTNNEHPPSYEAWMWKWLFIGTIVGLFSLGFGFVTAAVFWYG